MENERLEVTIFRPAHDAIKDPPGISGRGFLEDGLGKVSHLMCETSPEPMGTAHFCRGFWD